MPKKIMPCQSITINHFNFSDWNPKSISLFMTLLGIQEACELEQAHFPDLWFSIGVLEKIIYSKKLFLPNWMGNYVKSVDCLPILDELYKINENKSRPLNTYPERINIFTSPLEFDFTISMPLETPTRNPKKWIKWCYMIKLLIYYAENCYQMNFLASRGILSEELIIYPKKEIGISFLLSYYENYFPKSDKMNLIAFPDYYPPYLEIEKRELLWSNPKKINTINLRKNVWFHILSHIGCSENIDFESMLKGINVLVKLYRDEKDNKYLKIIGNCMGLIFSNFNYKLHKLYLPIKFPPNQLH